MNTKSKPFVSIITPVYNTEKYLSECIESVLSQTYPNWEYIIVNNCSTDRSLEISKRYGDRDDRIRLHNNEEFLKIIPNWNNALRLISPESKYFKFVHADDWLFPECVEQMVELAEENSNIGIVGSYRLDEDRINCDGLPYTKKVFAGRDICRRSLLKRDYFFGSPTTLLMRSDLAREYMPFYKEEYYHADNEVCYRILVNCDFGFIHQVLSYTRRHNETNTSFTRQLNTFVLEELLILKEHGRSYLDEKEYQNVLSREIQRYYRFLGLSLLRRKNKDFWQYHHNGLKKIGHPLNPLRLLWSSVVCVYNKFLELLRIR